MLNLALLRNRELETNLQAIRICQRATDWRQDWEKAWGYRYERMIYCNWFDYSIIGEKCPGWDNHIRDVGRGCYKRDGQIG